MRPEPADPAVRGGDGSGTETETAEGERRFPLAAPPEIMRAAEKDEQYASFLYDACRDAFRHLFGTRVAVAYQNETKLLGQMLYYLLTTGSGQQTLGEEYCDITQVADSYGLPPTRARRTLFILYQTVVPYIAERVSSRIAARGIILADSQSEELHGTRVAGRNQIQSPDAPRNSSNSTAAVPTSALSRLKGNFSRLWLSAVQRWPTIPDSGRFPLDPIVHYCCGRAA
ncbi:Peroxisome biogenesis factor 10 [Acorus gramineus]|uniref:RING-type E3 ubiquitin transferase n=1 Tax=Acorus gramineus TaxID=55184 RepID=A0AAV9AFY5_ACOGR|nr:Peroxisome biogenesis factor 10 [Acorus gramineus]